MECSRINELFSEYLDEVLDDSTRRTVEEHLAACGSCAEELSELRSCLAALGSLDTVTAPGDFLEQVRERIEREEQTSFLGWLKAKLFFPLRVKIPLEVAGLAMAALLVVFIYHEAQQGAVPSPGYAPLPSPAPLQTTAPGAEKLDRSAAMRAPLHDELSQKEAATAPQSEAPAGEAASSRPRGENEVSSPPGMGGAAPDLHATGEAAPRPAPSDPTALQQRSESVAPTSQDLRDASVRQQLPKPADATKPIRLLLVIGPTKGGSVPLAEQDGRMRKDRRDQPGAAPVPPSTSKSEEAAPAAAPAPAPPARAVPRAAPSVAERSAAPSTDQAAGGGAAGAADKDLAKSVEPADAEAQKKSVKGAARAGEAKPSVDKAKLPAASASREGMDLHRSPEPMSSGRRPELPGAQQALAEIKSFIRSAGGSIEAVKPTGTTRQPQSLTVRVPAQSIPALLDLLGRLGQLRGAPEARVHTSGSEPVLVQISFEQVP
jgi:hypothetical protein